MTILAELGGTVTVTDDGSAYLLGDVEVTDDGLFWIELTVDDRAAVAFAQRLQRVGIRVDLNDVTLSSREVVNDLVIEESTDSYGDRITVSLAGERFSPFARGLIRSKAKLAVRLKIGSPGKEFDGQVFSGYIVEPSYDLHPPVAGVVCLDAAALHAEKRLKNYSLPPNSGRTRLSIYFEMCGLADIPVGATDLGGDGGIVNKPVAPGDQPLLDFFRDFLGAICVEIGFENGLLVARRFDATLPAVLELHAGNIVAGDGSIASPLTLSPNVTGVVSVSFSREEIGGKRTDETSVITVGPYALMSASGPVAEQVQVLSEVVTRTTYLGSLDVRTEETTKGIYAPLGASDQIEPDAGPSGYVINAYSGNSYLYPDGSTRATPIERLRDTSKTVRTKDVDADYRVIRTREERYFFHFLQTAIWEVVGDEDILQTGSFIPLSDDGMGLLYPYEVIGLPASPAEPYNTGQPDELTEVEFTLNPDGTIQQEVETFRYYSIGSARRRADGAWGYGVDSVTYTSQPDESLGGVEPWFGERVTTRRYRSIDEDHYEVTESVKDGLKPPTVRTSKMTGALPRPERAEPVSTSQEIRSEVRDLERIALSGEEISATEHNEFIESSTEAAAYARHLAREAGALRLTCTIPLEVLVHKWRCVIVHLPGTSINNLRFFVKSVTRDVAEYKETIVAAYYPPSIV